MRGIPKDPQISYFIYERRTYKLRSIRHRLIIGIWFFVMIGFTGLVLWGGAWAPAAAQESVDSTPTETEMSTNAYITVTYIEAVNVRTGPSSFDYPIVGSIPPGDTAPAIGRSPAGEWIQIAFPDAPQGKGWVYAPNVELSSGALLPIVEPPPTQAPLESPTPNPTFLAAFQTEIPPTRLPTFTPPPPHTIPTFTNADGAPGGRIVVSWVILGLGLTGMIFFLFSTLRRR